jgi:uncharacterized protein
VRSPSPDTADISRRGRASAVALLLVLTLLGACVPTGERPVLTDEAIDDIAPPAGTPPCPLPGEPFEAFGATVVRVSREEAPLERCVLVADTVELRARGLMEVSDLAGYDGMLFAFPDDTLGGFWMANTLLALSIAYIDVNGAVVTVLDMEPCPEAVDCPSYEPGVPYRWALEVPQGALGDFGVGPGSRFDVDTLPQAGR